MKKTSISIVALVIILLGVFGAYLYETKLTPGVTETKVGDFIIAMHDFNGFCSEDELLSGTPEKKHLAWMTICEDGIISISQEGNSLYVKTGMKNEYSFDLQTKETKVLKQGLGRVTFH